MAGFYTYDDFQKAAADSGLLGQFSDADLRLAQKNADAGMSLLNLKKKYQAAQSDEERARYNLEGEQIRSQYGGYTGGGDGSGFFLEPLSPGSFQAGAAPSYENNYADTISGLLDRQLNYGSFNYDKAQPEYKNRYDDTIQDLLGQLTQREEFSYDPETDPLYSQYKKQYSREGQRATQEAMGAAAAASGGLPSSYAATAAAQAGNYYAGQMADKVPELYQLAYNKYLNDYNMKRSDLSAVQGAEQSDYDKYLNAMQQYNTDKAFAYQAWQDGYSRLNNDLQTASGLEQLAYTKYLNDLNQYNTDRSFAYGQLLDEVNNQTNRRSEELNRALAAAEMGDYSFLQAMGFDTSNNPTEYQKKYNAAILAAEYGDFSGLRELGINPDAWALYNFNAAAAGKGTAGSYGGSGGSYRSGNNNDGKKEKETMTAEQLDLLKKQFPNGEIDTEYWNALVSGYDVTEAQLKEWGFKRALSDEEVLASNQMKSMIAAIEQNQKLGIKETDTRPETAISNALAKGYITERQAQALYHRYGITKYDA